MKRAVPYLLLLGVTIATLSLYLRTAAYAFVTYDDPVYVSDNPRVGAGLTRDGIVYAFTTGETGSWQPLTLISHMVDCSLYGLKPAGHHVTNAILHALSTLLLGIALLRLTGSVGPGLFVAAVFGLHPTHVESVAWIAERKDVLSAFFFMATLIAYAEWARTMRRRWLGVATVLMALGLLAKPMLVTVPFVLLLLDYWPLRRVRAEGGAKCIARLVAEKAPMLVMAVAVSVITLVVQRNAHAISDAGALPLAWRLENAAVACFRYIGLTIWPSGLVMYYPHPRGGIPVLVFAGALVALVLVTAVVWTFRRRAPYLVVGWCWYLVTLLPVIGIIQVGTQAIADRYTYIPTIGVAIMVAWGMAAVCGAWFGTTARGALWMLAVVAVAGMSWRTWGQITVWRDSESLFSHTLSIMPDNEVAHMGLGQYLVKEKRFDEAVPHLEFALKARHRESEAHYNLGIACAALQRPDEALAHYRASVAADPGYSLAWNNLGVLYAQQNQLVDALDAFEHAYQHGPMNAEAVVNYGLLLLHFGKASDAESIARAAIERMPWVADLRNLLGSALAAERRYDEAIAAFNAALAIDPNSIAARKAIEAITASRRAGTP